MKLKSIGAQNFLHFGPWSEVEFDDDRKIVSIIGQWADEPSRSNRSGKSSLAEIFCYAFYGKSRAKKEIDLINRHANDVMLVKIVFIENGKEIVIQRGRSLDGDLILDYTGFEGADKKVVQAEINKLIGMTYEDFVMTSFFLQGDIHTFMEAGSTGQRNAITKWLEKEYWKDYESKAKEFVSKLEKKIEQQKYIVGQRPDLTRDTEIKGRINHLENKREYLETNLEALSKALDNVQGQLNKADDVNSFRKYVETLEKEIKTLIGEIATYNRDLPELKEAREEAVARQTELNKLDGLYTQLHELKSALESLKDEVNEASNLHMKLQHQWTSAQSFLSDLEQFDNICPVMNKQCVAIEAVTGTAEEVREKVENFKMQVDIAKGNRNVLAAKLGEIQSDFEAMAFHIQTIERYKKLPTPDSIDKKIEVINEKKSQKSDLIKSKRELIAAQKKVIDEYESIDFDELQSKKVELNEQIRDNKSQSVDIINSVARLKAELDQLKEKRVAAIKAEREIAKLSEQMNIYKYTAYMFSKNGIPSYQIEAAFEEIEEESNLILEKLYSDLTVEFRPDKETDTWETNCVVCGETFPKNFRKTECPSCGNERQKKRKDSLHIIIKTKSEELDFSLESGGGKVLISLAIRLAFVRLLQRRIGINFKVIVLDEIFGMLDQVNRAHVFKLLTTSLINDFGFELVLAISHEEEIRDAIPNVIKVTRFEEHSTFTWG